MDDELEDKVLYQTFVSHMKILSKFAVGVPSLNSTCGYLWKLFRIYLLRPEILICGIFVLIVLVYLQAADVWRNGLFSHIQNTLGSLKSTKATKLILTSTSAAEKESWEIKRDVSAVYAVQGRRSKMEDRFVVDENINKTGISMFAIFDGHGGEFAADFAKDILIKNIYNKIVEASIALHTKKLPENDFDTYDRDYKHKYNNEKEDPKKPSDLTYRLSQRKTKKTFSMTEDCINKENCKNTPQEDFLLLNKLSLFNKDTLFSPSSNNVIPQRMEAKTYIDSGKINFGKLLTDEVLAADYRLVEQAKKTINVAGTTALIAIMQDSILTVANVGDSRGVMCDSKGNAIQLSFDHKPQLSREKKRIEEAGGFIAFKGVWRVAGILATSRALGDYPLKDKNLVIADPDILTFDLADHKPMFLILASDGLWDTFSNEEAVAFIKEHIDEPHFGAKSITLQSYYRGSVDNITVLVIVFKNGKYKIGSSHAEAMSS